MGRGREEELSGATSRRPGYALSEFELRKIRTTTFKDHSQEEGVIMTICLSHGGQSIFTSDGPSDGLWVATADGLYLLNRTARGKHWKVAQRVLEGKHVNAVVFDPSQGVIVAGMHNGGIAVSEDAGKSWEFRNEGLTSHNVYAVSLSRSGGHLKLYAGTEPVHLFVSDDVGRRWQELTSLRRAPSAPEWRFPAPPNLAHVKFITFDPQTSGVIYVCIEQGGLLKSTDGGSSWEDLTGRGFNDDCHRLIIRPSHPHQLFLPTGFGFYCSQDGGTTWTNISEKIAGIGYPDLLVYHPHNDQLMFVAGAGAIPPAWAESGTANPKIARSRDGGETWTMVGRGLPEELKPNFEAMTLEGWKGGSAVYIGNTDGEVYVTEDEGETWTKIIQGLPAISKGGHYLILRYGFRGLAQYDAYTSASRPE